MGEFSWLLLVILVAQVAIYYMVQKAPSGVTYTTSILSELILHILNAPVVDGWSLLSSRDGGLSALQRC